MQNSGKISHQLAVELAEKKYDKFYQKRLAEEAALDLDFEQVVKALTTKKKTV